MVETRLARGLLDWLASRNRRGGHESYYDAMLARLQDLWRDEPMRDVIYVRLAEPYTRALGRVADPMMSTKGLEPGAVYRLLAATFVPRGDGPPVAAVLVIGEGHRLMVRSAELFELVE